MRHEIIQQFLAAETAIGAHESTIADVIVRALRLLLAELQPLVGAQASRALYARSIHLTRPSCDWPSRPADLPASELLAFLQGDLAPRPVADARRAGEALLLTFVDLLISMIGEPLTYRLLRSAWDNPAADKPFQEKAQ
ncbi:MAG: hypothetical protein WKG52_14530 [Variovorax sp.]